MTKIWIEHPASAYIIGYVRNQQELGRKPKRQAAEPFGKLKAKPIVFVEDVLKSEHNENASLTMGDFFSIGSDWFMSDKLVKLLVDSGCKIEHYDSEIEFDESSNRPVDSHSNYNLVNITDKHTTICRENSSLVLDKDQRFKGWIERIKKLVFTENAERDHMLWHEDKLHDFMVCCSDSLADAIMDSDFTGVFFVDAKDYKAYVVDQDFDF